MKQKLFRSLLLLTMGSVLLVVALFAWFSVHYITNDSYQSLKREATLLLETDEDGRITLKVTDNGIGFKPFTYKSGSHQGLASIGEQVSLLDGTMNIQPASGGGTAVVISMPMNGGDSYENFVGR